MIELCKVKVLNSKYRCGQLIAAVFALSLFLSNASAQSADEIRIEAPKRGIPAELVDAGDYYFHPDGRKLKFFRKKDVYAIKPKRTGQRRANANDSLNQIEATFGNRVERVKGHRLGGMAVVRTSNPGSRGFNPKQATTIIDANALKVGMAQVDEVLPVLANSTGNGDILVSNKLVISLADGVDEDTAIERLSKRFGLSVIRKINMPGMVYSMQASRGKDVGQRFERVRRIANSSLVAWAQPQFSSRPFKTQSFPNSEPLFSQQWHLQNNGFRGSLCDADCNAANAWGSATNVGVRAGAGTVIAIIDDGVQLNHPEFAGRLWRNPGETGPGEQNNGLDDDGNGFIDDFQGWDFVDDGVNSTQTLFDADNSSLPCVGANDGDFESDPSRPGQDNNPSGNDFANCVTAEGDAIAQDDHGTAVAGLAAAGANNIGTLGTAFNAEILPIRLVSDFDTGTDADFCLRAAEAITYAGRYAHVVNNSWALTNDVCIALEVAIEDVVNGDLPNLGGVAPVRGNLGSPVIFSSGNSASGWVRVEVPVAAGNHAYEWRFLRSSQPDQFEAFAEGDDDAVYIDDIEFPDNSVEDFESGLGDFTNRCVRASNACVAGCDNSIFDSARCPGWRINTNAAFSRSGRSASIGPLPLVTPTFPGFPPELDLDNDTICSNSYLHIQKGGGAGTISFWVWMNSDQSAGSDKFEFLIDGTEVVSFGDLVNPIDNAVAFPALLEDTIAVGASDSGPLVNVNGQRNLSLESRIFYSQFGPELDVLAPSSTQHIGITTTDRFGTNTPGFDPSRNFTDTFGGTSASAPIVAGIAAAIIAVAEDNSNNLDAEEVRQILRDTADQIGPVPYNNAGRNNFHGHGRVNMASALVAAGSTLGLNDQSCASQPFDYSPAVNFPGNDLVLASFSPIPTSFCQAEGPLAVDDTFCFTVFAENENAAVVCF